MNPQPPKTANRRTKLPFAALSCPSLSFAVLSCLALSLVALTGCGYHQSGAATHIPANVRTLSIPIFATKVQAYHTEVAFTQAVVRELDTRTKYRILSKDDAPADATLRGTILSQTIAPLTYDASTGQTSSYLVTVTASIYLTARDGRTLYQNPAITYREQFQSTQDLSGFIQENGPAINRLSRDFAQALVGDMLESF